MNGKKSVLIFVTAIILLAGLVSSYHFVPAHAAPWTLNLDAAGGSQTKTAIATTATDAHGFRIGAMLTGATATNSLTVFGWEFSINYNASAVTPIGDPDPTATPGGTIYVDSARNTVLFGANGVGGCHNWVTEINAGNAFTTTTNSVAGSVGKFTVAFTMLAGHPVPVVTGPASPAGCLFANVAFEINGRVAPITQTFTISDVIFVDSNGGNIPGVSGGGPITETISDVAPTARIAPTHLATGSTACTPITGVACTAFAWQFDGTTSTGGTGTISATAGTAGYFWDFGDTTAGCGASTGGSCDGFWAGSTGNPTPPACTNPAAALFGCQGGVAIHDYNVAGSFNVTLRVQSSTLDTGSSRDSLGNVILNSQPSHTQLLNFNSAGAAKNPTTTSVACNPSTVVIGQGSSCAATVMDTATSGATTPTGSVSFSSTGAAGGFTPASSCTLSGTGSSATCSVTFTGTAAGSASISASYPGDSGHNPSQTSTAASVTINPRATSTTVSCTLATVQGGSAASCTATVTDTSPSTVSTPTGTVSFTTNSTGTFSATSCSLVAGASGTASCSVNYTPAATAVGHHLITGTYVNDATHTASNGSFKLAVTAIPAHTTTTTVNCTPSSVQVSVSTSCTATVTDTSATPTTPTGTVSFTTNSTGTFSSTSCTLVAGATGTASCSVNYTPGASSVGHHLITGTYVNDATHTASSGTFKLAVTPAPPHATSTTVSCSPASVQVSVSTSCTATVTDTGATPTTPTGTVSFTTNSTGTFSSTSCTLVAGAAGTASCSANYTPGAAAVGHHLITGTYVNDATHSASSGTFLLAVTPAPPHTTTTTVSCNPGSVQVSTPTSCTATVTDTNTSPTTPTGSVNFTTNSTGTFSSTSCSLVSGATGTASCSVTYTPGATAVGHHLITGTYSSDATHSASSGSFKLAVTSAPPPPPHSTSTTVQCSPSSVQVGVASTCTATVTDTNTSPTTPTGSVSFTTNSTGVFLVSGSPSCTLSAGATAGTASCSVTYMPGASSAGHHLITGTYSSDATHTTSNGSFNLAVTPAPPHTTTTTVSCNPGSVQVSTPTSCTATVTDTNASPTTPTGSVSFTTNSTGTFSATSCTLVAGAAGTASCSVNYTPGATSAGHHLITGTYVNDATHTTSSGSFKLTVTSAPPPPPHNTTTIVICSPALVLGGTLTSCTATVTDTNATPTTPTGSVSFTTNSTGVFSATSCTLVAGAAGTASCPVQYSPDANAVGHHLITGTYNNDATHTTSSGSFKLTVTPAVHQTTTTVTCSPASVQVGTPSSCTATVTDTNASPTTPTGTVDFTTNSTGTFSSSSCTLLVGAAGTASCSVNYTPGGSSAGHHVITGTYIPDATHGTSNGAFKLTVTSAPPPPPHNTTASVSCAPSSVQVGSPTTCTATVSDTAPSPTAPTGTVIFTSDSQGSFSSSGACSLSAASAGTASCSVTYTPSATGSGTHKITGTYNGDSTHNNSSGQFSLTVTSQGAADFTITSSRDSLNIQQDESGRVTITVTSIAGFSGTISFETHVTPHNLEQPSTRFTHVQVTLSPGGTAKTTLKIFADDDTPEGTYTVTVVATGGGISHSVAIQATVTNSNNEGAQLLPSLCLAIAPARYD